MNHETHIKHRYAPGTCIARELLQRIFLCKCKPEHIISEQILTYAYFLQNTAFWISSAMTFCTKHPKQ